MESSKLDSFGYEASGLLCPTIVPIGNYSESVASFGTKRSLLSA